MVERESQAAHLSKETEMSIKEQLNQALEGLGEAELQEVADYVAFLRFRARTHTLAPRDVAESASLYAEFAQEDRRLADEGIAEYREGLVAEDTR